MAVSPAQSDFVMHSARAAVAGGLTHIEEQVKALEGAVVANTGLAFDLAKTLVESACKTIITERGLTFDKDDEVGKVFKSATMSIPFLPPAMAADANARKSLSQTLAGLNTALQGVCELRNAYGFASHGSDGPRAALENVHAILAAQTADAIVGFLYRVHCADRSRPITPRLEFSDNPDFNEWIDQENAPVRIFSLPPYRPSEVLFNVDREAYRDLLDQQEDENEGAIIEGSSGPEAKPILPGVGSVTTTAGDDHAAASMYSLLSNYSSRFSDTPNPFVAHALKSVKDGLPLVVLHVPHELIESGDTTLIASALCDMVSTRENAAAFRQRVGVMVDGFDDDPRGLWVFPKVQQFFRRLFVECPFVMLVAHPEGGLLKLLAACWLYNDELSEEVEQQRMTEFLNRAFHGLNSLNHSLALSEEQNREICMAAARALFGETPPS